MSAGLSLCFVLAAGALLRFHHIGYESLWLDEGYSALLARQSLQQILAGLSQDLHPPVYGILLHGWTRLFGESEAALRSLSALFGVLLIFVVYRFAKDLSGSRTAFYAALITALSTFHVYYSQEARSYTLMALLAAASFRYFFRLVERPRASDAAWYLVCTTLLLYTHSFGLLTVAAENLVYAVRFFIRRPAGPLRWTFWAALQLILGLLWSPWVLISLGQTRAIGPESWISRPDFGSFLHALRTLAGGFKLLGFYGAAIVLGLRTLRGGGRSFEAGALLAWAGTVVVIPLAVSWVWTPVFVARYLAAATVPLILLAAIGIASIEKALPRRTAAAILVLFCLHSLYLADRRIDKEEWRPMAAYLSSEARPGELVILSSSGTQVLDYYLGRNDLDIRVFPASADKVVMLFDWAASQITAENVKELEQMSRSRSRVWLIQTHEFGEKERVQQTMQRLFGPPSLERPYHGVRLTLYGSDDA